MTRVPASVLTQFDRQAAATPEGVAVEFGQQRLTYRDLDARAHELACFLRNRGAGPDALVGLCLSRSVEAMCALLGVLKAGSAYLPLDLSYPAERIQYMLTDARAKLVLTQQKHRAFLSAAQATLVALDDPEFSARADKEAAPWDPPRPEELAYVIYTSGSTGRPKGVAMVHRALGNLIEWQLRESPNFGPGDRTIQFTSLNFDVSFQEIFATWCSGGTLVLMPEELRYDPVGLWQYMATHRVNRIFLPFIALQQLAEVSSESEVLPAGLREVVTAGEQLQITPKIRALFRRLPAARLHNHYGPSETHVVTAYTLPQDVESWTALPPIGTLIANTSLRLLDSSGKPVAQGETGELYFGGDCLARGYLHKPELTAERFVRDPSEPASSSIFYRTGDLARILPDGNIEYLGRIDNQLKIRGFRVEVGEIEATLAQFPGIKESAVVASGEGAEKRLVAYFVPNPGISASAEELRDFLKGKLADYMVPAAFVALPSLPLTPSGKVDRRTLSLKEVASAARSTPLVAPANELERIIAGLWSGILGTPEVSTHDNFFDIGGNSILLGRVHRRLVEGLGREIPIVTLFRFPTIVALAAHLASSGENAGKGAPAPRTRRPTRPASNDDAIAVVGISGRFPGARDVREFWDNLCAGRESITQFSDEELLAGGANPEHLADPAFVRARGVLRDVDMFDAEYFGMTPREAEVTDPQQRLMLECVVEALEDAGIDPDRSEAAIGIYAGSSLNTYFLANVLADRATVERFVQSFQVDQYNLLVGADKDYIATRIAYKLNLRGPALTIQTACSTSLVAVAQAVAGLRAGQCDVALAGGVSASFPQARGYVYQEGAIASSDGHCRAFDAHATGTVFGAGAAVLVLKRLADAVADGDHVYAVVRGAAINNDGAGKMSFSAPSVDGQAEVIMLAQEQAGVSADTISYVEAHGTGTPLGDPIEIAALTQAFRATSDRKGFCALGSAKSNVGHLEAAGGATGLIKTVLALHHRKIPASLHCETPNPRCEFDSSPFHLVTELTPWEDVPLPRRAGVSAFGVGGTNAHVVVEEAPALPTTTASRPSQLLTFSARTRTALERMCQNLASHLENHPECDLADAAYTLHTGRRVFSHRCAVVANSVTDAIAQLRGQAGTQAKSSVRDRTVVFLFPGQGSQYVGMGRELYSSEVAFRSEVDRCAEILAPHLGMDLRKLLFAEGAAIEQAQKQLDETRFAQPALFVIEYALARLWMSWGVRPGLLLGHSIGEFTAAVIAGSLSLPDALSLVAARGRMMQALPAGSMMAVRMAAEEIAGLLPAEVTLSAHNSPASCTIAGPTAALEAFRRELESRGVACRLLPTSHAFHSPMMDPVVRPFSELVAQTTRSAPHIAWISTATGRPVTADDLADPAYWGRQIRQPVLFDEAVRSIVSDPRHLLLEVGPGHALTRLAQQNATKHAELIVASSLGTGEQRAQEVAAMLSTLGRLWSSGVAVDWEGFHATEIRRRVSLPAYPFERKRHWIGAPVPVSQSAVAQVTGDTAATPIDRETQPVAASAAEPASGTPAVARQIERIFHDISGLELGDHDASFLEAGFDSLLLTQASQALTTKFGLKIGFRELMGDLNSIRALAAHVEGALSAPAITAPAVREATSPAAAARSTEPVTIPLSEEQQEIWIASLWSENASKVYNDVRIVRVRGELQVDVLRDCLQDLVERHDALRIVLHRDEPTQTILPHWNVQLPLDDLSALPAAERESRVREIATKIDDTPFNLVEGPLFHARLLRLAPQEHVLLFAYHHVVVDGWSSGVILDELARLYTARTRGEAAGLPLAMQYRDYVAWQKRPELAPVRTAAEEYWVRLFSDRPSPVELPADAPNGGTRSMRSARVSVTVGDNLQLQVKEAAQRLGCTSFILLLGTYLAWMRRVTGRSDLIVGIPFAGQIESNLRAQAGSRQLVGHCVNFLPIRVGCESEDTFDALIARVRERMLEAQEHQCFTFGNLLSRLNVSRETSRPPLVSTIFNLLPYSGDALHIPGLEATSSFHPKGFNLFDLHVYAVPTADGLALVSDYNSSLFTREAVERWLGQYLRMLTHVIARPDTAIDRLPMLQPSERVQLLETWNATQRDYPREARVHELFEAQARQRPHAIALVFENKALTYGQLNERAETLAQVLRANGVGPNVRVGLCVERSFDMVVGMLGILKAGGAYVPLDPAYPADRIAFVLEDSQASTVVTQRHLLRTLPSLTVPVLLLDEPLPLVAESAPATALPASSTDLAYVLYTSGSTGKPKGVQIEHRALVNFLNAMRREPGLSPNDVLLAVTTLSFDIAGLELHLPLTTGARIILASRETAMDGQALQDAIASHAVTVLQATPASWRLLLAAGWQGSRGLRCLCGGEPLPADLARELLPRVAELWNMYGPTETTIWSTCCRVLDPEDIHIGRPIDNTEIYILDGHQEPLPVGLAGELLIGGDGLARGYWNRAELTAEKFIPHPFKPGQRLYRTGDLARYRRDGNIECLGRLDFQVKIRGYRIELGEIENQIVSHPGVRQAVVIASDDASGEKRLLAFFVPRAAPAPDTKDLRQHLRGKLPDYMLPAAFYPLTTLPLTPNGKIDRKALRVPDTDRLPEREHLAPRNETEARLAEVYSRILNIAAPSVSDSFFDLGGHSLLAVRLLATIQRELGVRVELHQLFNAPSIAELAQVLDPHLVEEETGIL